MGATRNLGADLIRSIEQKLISPSALWGEWWLEAEHLYSLAQDSLCNSVLSVCFQVKRSFIRKVKMAACYLEQNY